ncbi:MAG: AbrB/MazE/SpoVT family DNA-binding domain-containing protein [Burkholderiaceae bacterium]
MSNTAIVSEKGQVTLPKPLRDRLGIGPGSRLAFRVAADGSLSVQVMTTGSRSLYGLLSKPGEAARSVEQMDAAVTQAVQSRSRRGR